MIGAKKRKKPLEAINFRQLSQRMTFAAREQYKILRTNLNFVLPDSAEGRCAVLGVTSSIPGEGKSTTAINLGAMLAEDGKRVLLIDADLRLPSIAKKFGYHSAPGLTDYLQGLHPAEHCIRQVKSLEQFQVMPSGTLPPNPSELLSSRKMARALQTLAEQYDFIILDLPPVTAVTDALAVSGMLTGMLLVIREDYTEKAELAACVRQLKLSEVHILGCVMNLAESVGTSYKKHRHDYRANGVI